MQTKQLLKIKIAQLLEIPHGTLLPLQEPKSQLMLNLLHIQIMLSMFNLNLKVSPALVSRELSISRLVQPPTLVLMQTKQLLMMMTALLMETQPGTLSPALELLSQRMLWLLHTQVMLSIFKSILNSIQDQMSIGIHHTFQPTTPIQRSMMQEPRLLQL
jgi:hypothetical protein